MSPFLGTRGAGSNRAFGYAGAAAPAQVTGLSATDFGTSRAYNNGRIDLSWSTPANNGATISGYKIERSTDNSTYSTLVANTGSATTTYSDTGLSSNQIYYYKVSAINAAGTGLASTAANATSTTVPQAPTIGTATAASSTSASITFTANATGGKAVSTYTATSNPSSITGTNSASPITVSGLTTGTSYTFTITATNANGTSTASAASNSLTMVYDSLLLAYRYTNDNSGFSSSPPHGDSSGNTYVGPSQSSNKGIVKFSPTGATSYQKVTSFSGYTFDALTTSGSTAYNSWLQNGWNWQTIDASGNLSTSYNYYEPSSLASPNAIRGNAGTYYICGQHSGTTPGSGFIARVNSSGTSDLSRYYSADRSLDFMDIDYDNSGNIYVIANYDGATSYSAYIIKFNSSGTIVWKRRLFQTSINVITQSMAVNRTNGEVYVKLTQPTFRTIAKLDSSGNLSWGRDFSTGIAGWSNGAMAVDNSGNLYIGSFDDNPFILKWDSGGTIQWQRQFTTSYSVPTLNSTNSKRALSLSSDQQHLLVSIRGNLNNTPNSYVSTFKVPVDGSKTGTYSNVLTSGFNITYTTASLSPNSVSWSNDTGVSISSTAFSVTRANQSPTGSNSASFTTDTRII